MALLHTIPIGDTCPHEVNAVVEIPRGSHNKYEYDESMGTMRMDRVLHSPLLYPADYGFIPHTRSEDGDSLDVLVLIKYPTFPGCVLSVRPIGVLDLEDEAGKDWKIIAVAVHDPYYQQVFDLEGVNFHLKREIKHFFATYKQLESDKTTSVGEWYPIAKAHEVIGFAHERYMATQGEN